MIFSQRLDFWSQVRRAGRLLLLAGAVLAGAALILRLAWPDVMLVTRSVAPDMALDRPGSGQGATPLKPVRVEPAAGPLRVHPTNSRYFTDGAGRAVYLTGSHTWCDFMDCGPVDTPPPFNYLAFLDFLQANNHNFFRLWRAENAKGGENGDNYWFNPLPYQRPGPALALDGKPKFDLNQFNQAYFDRLRSRVSEAGQRGIYVSIMLFDGWSVESKFSGHNPWQGHPFNQSNNINGINGDTNNNGSGEETHTLQIAAVTALQEAYVRKVVDAVNDLDNVLYEISNESATSSRDWQYHMINYLKSYEAGKARQHPVGMTVEFPDGDNADLFASPADWISPNGDVHHPPAADGSKVILNDTDHLCGICGDRQWVWKSLTRGVNPIFMDPYDKVAVGRGAPPDYDPQNDNDVSIRRNLGYALTYANRINLAGMTPHGELCSTGYCLANPAAGGAEYLVYLPAGGTITTWLDKIGIHKRRLESIYLPSDSTVTVDLSAAAGQLSVEWFDPATGITVSGGATTGGAEGTFIAPFSGDAVLYLYRSRS